MDVLTLIIDSRGAVYPYTLISKRLNDYGVNAKMYITADIELPADFVGAIHDTFNTDEASRDYPVHSAENNTLKLLRDSQRFIKEWVPGIIRTILDAIEEGTLVPENTIVIGNSPTLVNLGHFLLELGFKGFIVLEPYRMIDWTDSWRSDKSQMLPSGVPFISNLLTRQGKQLTKKIYGHTKYGFKDIKRAVIAQGHMYSPLLCGDRELALGYPYEDINQSLADSVLEFIDRQRKSGKKLIVLTLGSMQMSEAKQKSMANELKEATLRLPDFATIVLGKISKYIDGDDSILPLDQFVPFSLLFQKVDLVIHHHGAGTMHTVLRAGKPSFAVTFVPDQNDWATRLSLLGISTGSILARNFHADYLVEHIERNLTPELIEKASEVGIVERGQYSDGLERCVRFVMSNIEK